ncbi:protein of unknown function DUF72 [Staphylothermus marinus F1]|uniref:DUF72 domain-containing protein n=1 Tax=Staphylothermus marinus (strain ATCC 43588 / DSM 3639 / JCM 9404 / F1) TaxID=399550 RepID=A3DPG3_STAMF|nr:DUF72 domain-containing protein [Staphylothermus marinus]ABN70523.1 protein of unknown function DUF72 [Staphylothermus marinus F1]
MEVYVGTSGWMYDWNELGSFDWYVKYSGLNAVELNASFYRFPFRNQVLSWSRKGRNLRWSIKVHRSITHYRRLSESALSIWKKFYDLFSPLDKYVDFYLFQMPPNFVYKDRNMDKIKKFYEESGLEERFALEIRHHSWFNEAFINWCSKLGLTLVSIDAPIGTWVVNTNGIIYLRIHGREYWYAYDYNREELEELVEKMIKLKPYKIYVFFNNDHWMLSNARLMKQILEEQIRR